jgi:hypothetical protein
VSMDPPTNTRSTNAAPLNAPNLSIVFMSHLPDVAASLAA